MRIDIITLFPKMFKGPFDESMIKRAQEKGLAEIKIHNLRQWAKDKHKTVDSRPFGGGPGMVLMFEPLYEALKKLRRAKSKVLLLTPQGKVFQQKTAQNLSKEAHLILVCGHYEGVDERVRKYLVDEEISIGDYVLTGGELPAMVVIDTLLRLVPGVIEKPEATKEESFQGKKLEYPQYARPANFHGRKVPEILLSGDHQKIKKWRHKKALERTRQRRPDLFEKS